MGIRFAPMESKRFQTYAQRFMKFYSNVGSLECTRYRGTSAGVLEIAGIVGGRSEQFNGWQQLHDSYLNGIQIVLRWGSSNPNASMSSC